MPELYPGQAEVIADKLQEAELLLQANQERLQVETDPEKRANLLRLIAGQSGTIGSYRRALVKARSETTEETRGRVIHVRVSEAEGERLESEAAARGLKLGQYIRQKCGLE